MINEKDESLNSAFELMIGGHVYLTLLSKFNTTYNNTDLTSKTTWNNYDDAILKTIEMFSKR